MPTTVLPCERQQIQFVLSMADRNHSTVGYALFIDQYEK